MSISAVFLDVDGVINDPTLLSGMWDAHLGEVLAPFLGSSPPEWGRANRKVWPPIWTGQHTWGTVPMTRIRTEATLVVTGMCKELGITPPSPERCFELWQQVDRHVAGTAKAAFPFAADAIRALSAITAVHTATGNPSWRVEALLTALGVRHLVGFPAGPDLVGIWKATPAYYERVLERTGTEPSEALVVDDTAECIALAAAVGAQTAHIWRGECTCPAVFHLPTLADLPAVVEAQTGKRLLR